jgi:protocatechuate 3,4-dioxygenase beta subunit
VKKLGLSAVLAVLVAATLAVSVPAMAASDKAPQVRTLTGQVTDQQNKPLAEAIVYLKNTKTMAVKTYIAGQDGVYRFNALSPNVDYEVHAEHQGKKSETKTLSSFDSRKTAYINLKIKE